MKKVLITGANSYIGTSFEKYMSQWPDQYQVDTIDMKDDSWLEKSFVGYDTVFHVAGIAHIKTQNLDEAAREKYWCVNAQLPIDVAKKAKNEGVTQYIFLSSMSVYGEHGSIKHPVEITRKTLPRPKDIYGKSKEAAERSIKPFQDSKFAVCILRPPMIYGDGCKGNYQLLKQAAVRLPLFPDFKNKRSMLFIDSLSGIVKELIDNREFGVFLPQDKEYTCTSKMVKEIASKNGKRIWLTKMFNPILRVLSGKITLVDKVFGDLVYVHSDSSFLDTSETVFPKYAIKEVD